MVDEILSLFTKNKKLKFSQIEKSLSIRSNKLAYKLKKLEKNNLLKKENDFYYLSDNAESHVPYISDNVSPLPVLLVLLKKQGKFFLARRQKRPYNGLLGLPGGRLLVGESIEGATKRIMKEKYKISAKYQKINSVTLEHLKKGNKIVHSFLLILVSAQTKDEIAYVDIDNVKKEMIKSDYALIKNFSSSKLKINKINSRVTD